MKHLGQILRQLRENHNYKQDWVARQMGMTDRSLRKIENGTTQRVKSKHLRKAAEIFQMSMPDLVALQTE